MSANQGHEGAGKAIELAEEGDLSLGKLLVCPSRREILADGKTEMIEPRVMQVLVALARRRGEVVSREQLIESCWGGRFVSEDALNRCMTKVRKLAAPDAFALETIPRVGYRLVAAEPPPAPVPPEALERPVSQRSPSAGTGSPKQRTIPTRRWLPWA